MKHAKFLRHILPVFLSLSLVVGISVPASAFFLFGKNSGLSDFSKSAQSGEVVSFTESDFTEQITGKSLLTGITISSLPDTCDGTLKVGDMPLSVGDTLSLSALSTLCFYPSPDLEKPDVSFTILPIFDSGNTQTETTITILFPDMVNASPHRTKHHSQDLSQHRHPCPS